MTPSPGRVLIGALGITNGDAMYYPPTDPTNQMLEAALQADRERLENERRCGPLPPNPNGKTSSHTPDPDAPKGAQASRPEAEDGVGGCLNR